MIVETPDLPPLDTAAVRQALDAAIDEDVVGALMRVDGPRGAWSATAGSAEAGQEQPVDPNGKFRVGSITKSFVATVVLQLVDEGEIGLDEPVQRYLPDALPAAYPPITVRQLLQHTSGIHNYTRYVMHEEPELILRDRYRDWTPEELVAIATDHPRDFEAGTQMGYSNTNYVLLGLIIQQVTGNGWGAEVDQRIAKPLGLTSTFAPGDDPRLPDPHAHGYVTVTKQGEPELVDITDIKMSRADAAGSMISSVCDLDVFLPALLAGELVPTPLLELMLEPFPSGNPLGVAGLGYGLGTMTLQLPKECGGQTIYGMGGGTTGYSGMAFSTRYGHRRLVFSFNTTGSDLDTGRTQKLVGITRLVFCGHQATPAPTATPADTR
jgi:D-alanyl-D-alanine carboxypeptidase